MKKIILLLLLSCMATACSGKVSDNLDKDYESGFNGILWGESKEEAATWLQTSKQVPVNVVEQSDPDILKTAQKLRKKNLKQLKLTSVPDIDDTAVVAYYLLGFQHGMNFDKQGRFSAITFGPPTPAPPVGSSKKRQDTQKKFEERIIRPLILKYGKPRTSFHKEKEVERQFWVWKGKKIDYVVEFIFVQETLQVPTHWQYSESILIAHPKYLK